MELLDELLPCELVSLEGVDDVLEELLDGEELELSEGIVLEELLEGDEPDVLLEALFEESLDCDEPPWTPRAARVCWSSSPEEPICLDCWNCVNADFVLGPIWPSTAPGSKPLSFRACCTWLTVELSPCEDACWLYDELELSNDALFDEFAYANGAAHDKATAAMAKGASFICISFP